MYRLVEFVYRIDRVREFRATFAICMGRVLATTTARTSESQTCHRIRAYTAWVACHLYRLYLPPPTVTTTTNGQACSSHSLSSLPMMNDFRVLLRCVVPCGSRSRFHPVSSHSICHVQSPSFLPSFPFVIFLSSLYLDLCTCFSFFRALEFARLSPSRTLLPLRDVDFFLAPR